MKREGEYLPFYQLISHNVLSHNLPGKINY